MKITEQELENLLECVVDCSLVEASASLEVAGFVIKDDDFLEDLHYNEHLQYVDAEGDDICTLIICEKYTTLVKDVYDLMAELGDECVDLNAVTSKVFNESGVVDYDINYDYFAEQDGEVDEDDEE